MKHLTKLALHQHGSERRGIKLADYEIDVEVPAQTQTVKFSFTPTLENAPSLLMDIAALFEKVSNTQLPTPILTNAEIQQELQSLRDQNALLKQQNSALVNQLRTISRAKPALTNLTHEVEVTPADLTEIVASRTASVTEKQPVKTKSRESNMPRVGEVVQIKPHDEYKYYTNGIIKGFKGRGAKYVIIRPLNHAKDETLARNLIKRFAANERKVEVM